MGNPFAPQNMNLDGSQSFDFGGMGAWGQPQGGGGGGTVDWQSQMQTLLANGDIAGASQIQSMLDNQTNNLSTQNAYSNLAAAQKPGKWATGAQTFGSVAQGLAGLGNIWLGFQGMKQQKKAFDFNKEVTNTNLNNSIMDYNRRLSDTLTNRSLNNGGGQGWVSDQLAKYSAKRG